MSLRTPAFRLLCIAALFATTACSHQTMRTSAPAQPPVELDRFMGVWHVIAHVPYFAERGHVASRDEYTLRADGRIAVRYVYREGFDQPVKSLESKATVKPDTGNRRWTTWFFGVIPTKYRIVETAPDYSWALVDYPGRDLAWIFARSPDVDDAQYGQLLARLQANGVDTTRLLRVAQSPEQVGKPGFETPRK